MDEYSQILIALVFYTIIWFYFSHKFRNQSSTLPTNWPILGMIPAIFTNRARIMYWSLELLEASNGNFMFKGPLLCKMDLLFTSDPADAQFVVGRSHHLFHKGPNFNEIFDVLGDGIFNSDDHKWSYQRKIGHSYFTSAEFRRFYVASLHEKLDMGLSPLLDKCAEEGSVVDLQDVFQRFNSDIIHRVIIGADHDELSSSDHTNFHRGIHDVEEALLLRHILPKPLWKFMRWLDIGKEKKMREASDSIDRLFRKVLVEKKLSQSSRGLGGQDVLSYYMSQNYGTPNDGFESQDSFLKDTFFAFLIAGQDSMTAALTWLFWLLIQHPEAEAKIRAEIREFRIDHGDMDLYDLGDSRNLVYLHGAILEALRLYPSVPFNHRAAREETRLPSGEVVGPSTMIIFVTHAMGRMRCVWGDDAAEFRPERWLTAAGGIKHVPSHKFFAFNTGPRVCLGKDMSLVQMKAVACHVLGRSYRFEVVEGHRVEMALSMVLHMKYGLKVKVFKND